MKRHILAAGILAVLGASRPTPLVACGDKFLSPPRGMTFEQAYRPAHPGSILIYAPAGPAASTAEYAKVQTLLTRVGHRVAVVHDAGQIAQTLAAVKADIVLTSLSEAGIISAQTGAGRAPLVLPVLNQPTKAEMAACKVKYPCDLKITDKPERFVVAVNAAMNDRAKQLATKHGN
ncbi:MAG: hypothetical protein ACHQO8_06655 [Vicinamibacterales bacterium]